MALGCKMIPDGGGERMPVNRRHWERVDNTERAATEEKVIQTDIKRIRKEEEWEAPKEARGHLHEIAFGGEPGRRADECDEKTAYFKERRPDVSFFLNMGARSKTCHFWKNGSSVQEVHILEYWELRL